MGIEEKLIKYTSSNTGQAILSAFSEFFNVADTWEKEARDIVVKDNTDMASMIAAKEARKIVSGYIKKIETTRKNLKEEHLRTGQVIDGIAKTLISCLVPIEKYLDSQENFSKIKKKEEEIALRNNRYNQVKPYLSGPISEDLALMSEEVFAAYLAGKIKFFDNQKEFEAKLNKVQSFAQPTQPFIPTPQTFTKDTTTTITCPNCGYKFSDF